VAPRRLTQCYACAETHSLDAMEIPSEVLAFEAAAARFCAWAEAPPGNPEEDLWAEQGDDTRGAVQSAHESREGATHPPDPGPAGGQLGGRDSPRVCLCGHGRARARRFGRRPNHLA
jgi:hypothetical protein